MARPGRPDRAVAVVTGASGGIGRAIAHQLDREGFQIAGVDLDAAALERALDGIPGAVPLRCDVSRGDEVARLREEVRDRLGSCWLLVNAAGVFFTHRIPDLAEADWDRTLDVNLKGPFLTCREFIPDMARMGSGCIVNIASTAALRGGHERAAYCASKAGLVMLTRSLALDHGKEGIRVNCVCPGLIDTPMADWITSRPDALETWRRGVPAQRIGTPEDIAGAVAYLASPAADYVHGATLLVDGGVSA